MQIPDYLHQCADQVLGVELDAAIAAQQAAVRRSFWAVVLGLVPYKDAITVYRNGRRGEQYVGQFTSRET